MALLSDDRVALYVSFMAKSVSLIIFFCCCVINIESERGDGNLQRETNAKNTSICTGVCGGSQSNRAE